MAYVDVPIDRLKLELVRIIKTRLDSLFNVVVVLITCPSENASDEDGIFGSESHNETVFLLRLSSANSPENIEKAKIFLKAILEEGPDFNAELCPLTDEQLEMVRRSSETIERQSLCLLDFVSNPSRLCLKGRALSIKSASQQVHKVIMGQGEMAVDRDNKQNHSVVTSRTCSGKGRTVHGTHGQSFSVDSSYMDRASDVLPFNKDDILQSPYSAQLKNLEDNFLTEGNCAESMRSYSSLVIDGDYSYTPSFCEADLIPRGAPLRSASLSSYEHLTKNDVLLLDCSRTSVFNRGSEVDIGREAKDAGSERNSAGSSDEDSGVSVLDKSDARYESRLEFALKLGYTEADLDRVIGHHGLDCDENKLLQELIVGFSGLADLAIDEGEGSSSPGILTPDITTSEIYQGVIKKVKSEEKTSNLRHIVIDGSNVAMSHGKNVFSCHGIKIAVDWFKQRGHEEITVFVPQWRKETSRTDTPITDQQLLLELEKEGIVVFTPARRIKGRRVVCYDDRFVLKLASETGGIVVSNDNYRDLLNENQEYRRVVDERLLMYTFVNDRFMPPEDPLGRRGPTLDNFLCKEPTLPQTLPPDCPYGRKCTYGNKCKFHHPERGCQPHRTVTEMLKEQATLKMQERATRASEDKAKRSAGNKPKLARTKSLVPGESLHAAEDKFPAAQSPLPSSLKESDTSSRVKSPTRSSKTSDYLREHRKKLEEHLAIADSVSTAQFESAKLSSSGIKSLEGPFASRTPEALSPLPVTGSRVSSPSHLNVPPYSTTQEGPLVSGHLLLAKKLSDEAAESSFFSNESSSNRASPVPAASVVGRQESLTFDTDKTFDRRPSLQDHALATRFSKSSSPAREQDKSTLSGWAAAPMRYPSQPASYIHDPAFTNEPQFGEQCQSYPPAEKEMSRGGLRRVTSYTDHHSIFPAPFISEAGAYNDHFAVKPQQSCPPSHLVQSPLPFSGHPFSGKMVRQNSSSDPQLHTAGSSDAFPHPWLFSSHASSTHQPAGLEVQGGPHNLYSPGKFNMASEVQQQGLYRSTSVQQQQFQPLYATHSPSLFERQMSEVVYSSDVQVQSPAFMPPTVQWGAMEMFHAPTSSPSGIPSPTLHHTHHHHHPLHQQQQLPGLGPMGHQGMAAAWSQQARSGQPPAMAATVSPPPRSYPPNQAISTTDPRYPLYYNLCGIFAEHRVRAVMNKFPDERDPQILTSHIMSM